MLFNLYYNAHALLLTYFPFNLFSMAIPQQKHCNWQSKAMQLHPKSSAIAL